MRSNKIYSFPTVTDVTKKVFFCYIMHMILSILALSNAGFSINIIRSLKTFKKAISNYQEKKPKSIYKLTEGTMFNQNVWTSKV